MRSFFTYTLIFISSILSAQTTADFENIELDSFLNGSEGVNGYASGNIFLKTGETSFGTWKGWAISKMTDTMTHGFTNQYSAATGSGENSTNYAVAFTSQATSVIELQGDAMGQVVNGFSITNGTYAYLSMLEALDGFTKKFGGVSGDDPDYFLLTIKKYLDGELSTDSVDFYLADYRFEDNSMDYIVKEWTYVDLRSLGAADSLAFSLSSTDNDPMFGMNTPAYFCIDNFITSDGVVTSLAELDQQQSFEVYPNPANDIVTIKQEGIQDAEVLIYNISGQLLVSEALISDQQQIQISSLVPGSYFVEVREADLSERQLLIKQ